jgi:acyl carrier protein
MESSLVELGFDSLDAINAMFELEDKFCISISDDHFRTLVTVGDVVNGIQKLVAAKSGQYGA